MTVVVVDLLQTVQVCKNYRKTVGLAAAVLHELVYALVHSVAVVYVREHIHSAHCFKLFEKLIVCYLRSYEIRGYLESCTYPDSILGIEVYSPYIAESLVIVQQRIKNYALYARGLHGFAPYGISLAEDFHIAFILYDKAGAACNCILPCGNYIKEIRVMGVEILAYGKETEPGSIPARSGTVPA